MTSVAFILCVAAGCGAVARAEGLPADGEVVARGVEFLVEVQEGEGAREWPYEGVYRVQGEIPIGYRVGGTAICALSLMAAAGGEGPECDAAIDRAAGFVIESIEHSSMAHDVSGGYDVRGWGYAYGLTFLLALRLDDRMDAAFRDRADPAIRYFIAGLEATEIPEVGGWNYARRGGFDSPGPSSPFMTAPTLLALFEAAAQGFEVDPRVVERALASLERGRTPAGAFDYAAGRGNRRSRVPGAVGRMSAAEVALYQAGRSSPDRLRGAVDAFLVHWGRLEERRSKTGTHEGPYGIAPYYFFYAHYYAALAIELLPAAERDEYRVRLRERLAAVRGDDGTFNDRVFARSASFGTAMAILSLRAPGGPPPAKWAP